MANKELWWATDDAVGIRSGRRFLEVCGPYLDEIEAHPYVQIADTDYTGTFTEAQWKNARSVAKKLNSYSSPSLAWKKHCEEVRQLKKKGKTGKGGKKC